MGTVRSLLTWLWGRYDVPQNVFLVRNTTADVNDDAELMAVSITLLRAFCELRRFFLSLVH